MHFIGLSLITDNVPRLAAFYERVFGVKAEGDAVHSTLALPGLNLAVYSREASIRDMRFASSDQDRADGLPLGSESLSLPRPGREYRGFRGAPGTPPYFPLSLLYSPRVSGVTVKPVQSTSVSSIMLRDRERPHFS